MGSVHTSRWDSVEQWSPTLFLVGGGLMVGHAALLGVQAFTNLSTPPDVFGPTGHLVALLGLVGLYPVLAARTPTVARIAGAVTAVTLLSWFVMTVTRLLAIVGLVSAVSDVLPGVFFMLMFVSTILTYVLFGIATVRIDDGSRIVGILVLTPAALISIALVDSAITGVTALEGVVIGSGLALSMLFLGHTLRTWDRPTDNATPAGKVAAG